MENKPIDRILMLSNDLRWKIGEDFHDNLTEGIYADASEIAESSVSTPSGEKKFRLDRKIDQIVTSSTWGFPIICVEFFFFLP